MRTQMLASALAAAIAGLANPALATKAPNMPVLPPPAMATAESSAAAMPTASPLDRALAGEWRSKENQARDKYRHPRETLAFFGVTADQTLLEIWPGGGWYTEILAPSLKGSGSYIAVVPDPARAKSERAKAATEKGNQKLRDMFAARKDTYGDAKLLEIDSAAPVLGAPNSVDTVLTFRNAHNWVMDDKQDVMFKAFYAVLKPGGTLGVVDHRARPDQPAAEMKTSGYLPEAYVISMAEAAGFKLAAKSEINANPADTKDYADGVWTLPPVLGKGDVDRAKYLAIGESDRMTLRFVKPATE